jgi:hypothetical protein
MKTSVLGGADALIPVIPSQNHITEAVIYGILSKLSEL